MGSTSDVVGVVVNPIGAALGEGSKRTTGRNILDPGTLARNELYDKPKQMQKEIEDEIRRQEEAARKAEAEYKKEQTAAKKEARDLALRNLRRIQSRLESPEQSNSRSGTILTSPLGVSADPNASKKTLLGY